jgi:hypothetical protein
MYILFLVMISGYGFGALTALLDSWGRSGRALAAIGTVAGTGDRVDAGNGLSFRIAILGITPIAAARRRKVGVAVCRTERHSGGDLCRSFVILSTSSRWW